jgi:hypothetical protein
VYVARGLIPTNSPVFIIFGKSPKIPLDKQSCVVLIYTSLRKRFTPPSEARNAEESEIQPDIKGLIFIASAPSQLNRDD